jgi:hypothetical protein
MDKLKTDIKNEKINDVKLKLNKIDNIKTHNLDKLSLNIKKLAYIMNLINYSINTNNFKDKKIIYTLKKDIKNSTGITLKKIDILNLLKKGIKNKKSFVKINKLKNNKINMKGGSMDEIFDWDEDTKKTSKILDITSFFLDILGLVPLYGIVFDGTNVILSLLRGDILNAAFSLISLVPIIGIIGPSLKLGYKLSKNYESSSDESSSDESDSE